MSPGKQNCPQLRTTSLNPDYLNSLRHEARPKLEALSMWTFSFYWCWEKWQQSVRNYKTGFLLFPVSIENTDGSQSCYTLELLKHTHFWSPTRPIKIEFLHVEPRSSQVTLVCSQGQGSETHITLPLFLTSDKPPWVPLQLGVVWGLPWSMTCTVGTNLRGLVHGTLTT